MKNFRKTFLALSLCILLQNKVLYACEGTFEIVKEAAFDERIFTQGVYLKDDILYISSGGYGASHLSILDAHGKVIKHKKLPRQIFAEGLTVTDGELLVLTWRSGVLFRFDPDTLTKIGVDHYDGEGWGLTHSEKFLILSDGGDTLSYRSKDSFTEIRSVSVKRDGVAIGWLNELEYAKGKIWANIWQSDEIIAIDPTSGHVSQTWNLSELRKKMRVLDRDAVLNGIAYDENADAFWLTGKLWPRRFLVRFQSDC